MIGKLMRAALRGVRAEIQYGAHWMPVSGGEGLTNVARKSKAGPLVSETSVMSLSAAWACMSRTSSLIGALPSALYRKGPQDSRDKLDGPLAEILTVKPNSEQTALEFWESLCAQTLLRGNGVSERLEVAGRLVGLRPLLNARPERKDGKIRFAVTDRGKTEYLPRDKVFHVPGFGMGDGIGLSAIRHGVQSFGAALASDETAASVFANSMMPGGVFELPHVFQSPEQRDMAQAMMDGFTGSSKAGKSIILEGGMKYQPLAFNPEDAQLLQTRRFSIEEVCRWFGTPPIIIGHSAEGQTMWGTGVEAIMLSWLTTGINPLLRRIEKRILRDLVAPGQQTRTYFEFNRQAMLQMDSQAMGEFMSKMGASGTMTANERRARLNLPRDDDPNADRLLAQSALLPLKDLGNNAP